MFEHLDGDARFARYIRSGVILVALMIIALAFYLFLPSAAVAAQQAAESSTDTEIAVLRRDIENLRTMVTILFAVVIGGGLFGFFLSMREDWRTGKAFKLALAGEERAKEAFNLALAGEKAAQERAAAVHNAFLGGSEKTIGLVNDTLQLAKDASDRAMKTLNDRATQLLEEIDRDARDLLHDMYQVGDFKAIVERPHLSARVQEVASRLSAIEGYLQVQSITLTSPCHFVKGIDRHLREEPNLAIKELKMAAELDPDDDLALFANYWIGYESNNLGLHADATDTFRRLAERFPNSPKAPEIRRIAIESEFFDYALQYRKMPANRPESERQALIAAVQACEGQLAELANTPGLRSDDRTRILTTQGNFVTWRAEVAGDRTLWQNASELFKAAGEGLWPRFSYLEARAALGEPVDPADYQWVIDTVMEKGSQRLEPRSKVLLFATRLIALARQPDRTRSELESAYGDILQATNRVNPLMRVYSQFTKMNIEINDATEELREFYRSARSTQ